MKLPIIRGAKRIIALMLCMLCESVMIAPAFSAVTVDTDDRPRDIITSGTIYDTDWSFSAEDKTMYFHLSDSPDWSTSGGQDLIPSELIEQTEHIVVDSNCNNSSDTGLLHQWLLGYDFTELAVSLKDADTVIIDGQPENFRSHDGVLFVVHDSLIETNDETVDCSEATVFVYPQQKTDREFTLGRDETLIYDGFRNLYYNVLPEYPLCRSMNYNAYLEAVNVEKGNIFGYSSEDGVVYSSGERKLVFCPKTKSGSAPISDKAEDIGAYAFSDCKLLTSADIHDRVSHIGVRAFQNCTSLESVELSDYIDPDNPGYNTRLIEDEAFRGCTSLKTVYAGYGQEICGFKDCISLESVSFAEGVEHIAPEAFMNCTSLKNIELPESLLTIGREAFENCSALVKIVLPEGLKDIGERSFFGCASLKTAEIKSNVLGCPEWYRENIEFLDSYTDCVQALRPGIFSNCTSLTDITVTSDNPSLYVKNGVLYQRMIFRDIDSVKDNIESPELLHIVGYEAGDTRDTLDLSDETELSYLTDYAFFGAHNLKHIILPETIGVVGAEAMSQSGLTEFTFPSTVNMIWGGVLSDCPCLEKVTFGSEVRFDTPICVNDASLKLYVFELPARNNDHVNPLHNIDLIPDIGGWIEKNSDGEITSGVYSDITIRANRFFNGALGYSDEFYEIADHYGWSFEDIATGERFDLSDPEKKPVSRYRADEESGVIVSICADRDINRGYEFDISAEKSTDIAALADNDTFILKLGENGYCGITIDTIPYIEDARYNGAEGYQVRIPDELAQLPVSLVDRSGNETPLNAISSEGYIIVDIPGVPNDTGGTAVFGDLDDDGEITANDALIALRTSVGAESLAEDLKPAADIDGDGDITANDALLILRRSVGMDGDSRIGTKITE